MGLSALIQILTLDKYLPAESERIYAASDYKVRIDSKLYIIPEEILGSNGEINICDLSPWEISDDAFM